MMGWHPQSSIHAQRLASVTRLDPQPSGNAAHGQVGKLSLLKNMWDMCVHVCVYIYIYVYATAIAQLPQTHTYLVRRLWNMLLQVNYMDIPGADCQLSLRRSHRSWRSLRPDCNYPHQARQRRQRAVSPFGELTGSILLLERIQRACLLFLLPFLYRPKLSMYCKGLLFRSGPQLQCSL